MIRRRKIRQHLRHHLKRAPLATGSTKNTVQTVHIDVQVSAWTWTTIPSRNVPLCVWERSLQAPSFHGSWKLGSAQDHQIHLKTLPLWSLWSDELKQITTDPVEAVVIHQTIQPWSQNCTVSMSMWLNYSASMST